MSETDTNVIVAPKRYRLTARAEMHGAVRDPGYIFTLADGEKGPCTTVVASNHGAQIADHMNTDEALVDQPLYVEVTDEAPAKPETVEPEISDEHRQDKARIAELEQQLADKNAQLAEAAARLAGITALKASARLDRSSGQ